MPIALLLGGISLIATLAGTAMQASAAKTQAEASAKTEELRKTQMNLETSRQKTAAIRQMLAARAAAQTAAVAGGVDSGSSGVQGGQGQIVGQTASNIQGITQANSIGSKIFDQNKIIAQAGSLAAFGQGLSSLGGAISGIKVG